MENNIASSDTSVPSNSYKRSHRKLYILGAIAACVVILVSLVLIFSRHSTSTKKSVVMVSHVCTSSSAGTLLQQAELPIIGGQQAQLLQIVKQIKKLPDYQYDPNCLYVIMAYYYNFKDGKDAQYYLNEFNRVYNPLTTPISTKLGPDAPDVRELSREIQSLSPAR